jgi:hypothetical protein
MAQYASVNQAAAQTATNPFQSYGTSGTPVSSGYTAGNTGTFVAPVNSEQNAGIAGTNTAANEAQPYYGAATGVLGASQAGVNPINAAAESGTAASSAPLTGNQINQYLSPYLGDVLGSTEQIQNQENQQAQAGQLGNAITSGAFGGDRTGIAAANLQQQEDLANSNVISGIANTGYQSALSTAQGQQQIGLAGANQLASIGSTAYGEGANTASELGSLGTGAQTAGLSGAQAQIAAGTVQQQTQQAQDTAQYNQFLQEQSYPFQVDEFLASIAEGTGALSGSTTTTTQPGGFFSDERLKEDMRPVGKTFDGQTIYRYKIKGDPRDRIGLSAQKTEKKHPEAVGLAGGFRYVDYGKATEDAANRGHFYSGGVVPMRAAYAYGGTPDNSGGLGAVLQAQQNMYASPAGQQRNIQSQGQSHQLAVASGTPAPPASGSSKMSTVEGLGKDAYQGYKYFNKPTTGGIAGDPGNTAGAAAPSQNAAGLTTDFDAPAGPVTSTPIGTTTDFGAAAPAQASGLGAADTGAAAGAGDVAAAGAGDVAAGAATGAAAGAAAEGGADAAAALAAEYAAADVAAAAIIAAKRGGKIRRRDLGGGTPYEGDGSDPLDIPDDQNTTKLQTAGPLVKQPTGLQSAMKMGDPTQASSMAGSIFSNEAVARGGVVGRGRFADGGTPDPDVDAAAPDATPDVASDADRGAGLAGGASLDSGGIWDSIKKHATAQNVIPILQGLAAMGTAKTVHPGVALAAGLGAGSQSYLDTQKSLADTQVEQQKAQGLQIANQLGQMKVQAAKGYLTPGGGGTSATPSGAQGVTRTPTPAAPAISPINAPQQPQSADPAAVAQRLNDYYKNKYEVTPWTPDEQAALKKARGAAIALGSDQPVQDATAVHDQRVQNQTYGNQKSAQVEADQLYKTATTDPDPGARQAAEAKYNAIHQWTGDNWDDKEGVRVNSRTGAPAIGVAKQQLPPSANILTDSFGRQYAYDQQSNRVIPVGASRGPAAPAAAGPAAKSGTGTGGGGGSGFAQSVADQPRILNEVAAARTAGDAAPQARNVNQQLLQLSSGTATGPMTATVQKLAAAAGLKSGSSYQEINAYLERQAATSAAAMGVPHTNAGLAASQSATGTTEYTPAALQEKVKFADAINSGAMAYREGLDKAIGTGDVPNLKGYQKFRSEWAKNFDPDVYRVEDAQRRGDVGELIALKDRIGPKGMTALKQKSQNLRMLENGQIPQ